MDDWLRTAAAARRLDVAPRVHDFIDNGELVAFDMGRVIRVRESDLDAFVEPWRIEPGTLGES